MQVIGKLEDDLLCFSKTMLLFTTGNGGSETKAPNPDGSDIAC